ESLVPACTNGDADACGYLRSRAIAEKHPEKAIAPLQSCLEKVKAGQPSLPEAELAELEGNLALVDMLSLQVTEAPPLFRSAIQRDFNRAPAHLAFALWLQAEKADDAAVQELDIVTKIEPDNY